MLGERDSYVHREQADDEGGQHNRDGNEGEGLDSDVEVVADDRGAGVHQACEDL